MKRSKYYLFLLFASILTNAWAQDPQFSQFYAAPIYHNPAFAGSAQKGRIISNFRSQYSGIFVTSSFSADNFIKKYNSGVGFVATIDRKGSAGIYNLYSSVNYAYEVNLSSTWAARGGLAVGIINSGGIDNSKTRFPDQLSFSETDQPGASSAPFVRDESKTGFDISSGFLVYSKHFWIGGSWMHMSQPNLQFVRIIEKDGVTNGDSRYPSQINLISGFTIPLEKRIYGSNYGNKYVEKTVSPSIILKKSRTFQQLDLGAYVTIKPLVFGMYYRDMFFWVDKELPSGQNRDALIFLLGYKNDLISVGYSYDLVISRLIGNFNTHELSFSYEFDNPKKRRKRSSPIPCPKF